MKRIAFVFLMLCFVIQTGFVFAQESIPTYNGESKVFDLPLEFGNSQDGNLSDNCIIGADGTRFLVCSKNGITFRFNSEISTNAVMNISAVAFEADSWGLFFLNKTIPDVVVNSDNAPDIEQALGHGAIGISGGVSAEAVKAGDFRNYSFNVKINKGINTLFIPHYDLSNDCGVNVYLKDGKKVNRNVGYKSISIESSSAFTLYPSDIPQEYLTYHANGMVVDGYDTTDATTSHTVKQDYESMYTVVPFYAKEQGDYLVSVYYNVIDNYNLGYTVPAAAYLDADVSGLKNDEWLKFLNDPNTYTADKRKIITDAHIANMTDNGSISSIDLGVWRASPSMKSNGASTPYYRVKTFELKNLPKGDHTITFYTAKGILPDTDMVVNQGVLFNSFTFEKNVSVNDDIRVSAEPIVLDYGNSRYYSSAPKVYTQLKKANTVYIPVSVYNNTDADEKINVMLAYYDSESKLLNVDFREITAAAHSSYENTLSMNVRNDNDITGVSLMALSSQELTPRMKNVYMKTPVLDTLSLKTIGDAEYWFTRNADTTYEAGYGQDNNQAIGGGNVLFKFNSPCTQEVTIDITVAAGDEWYRNILAFFNPVATPTSFNSSMVSGIDYPLLSENVLNCDITAALGEKMTITITVNAKQGENSLWFPGRNLSYDNNYMYTNPSGSNSDWKNWNPRIYGINVTPTVSNLSKTGN